MTIAAYILAGMALFFMLCMLALFYIGTHNRDNNLDLYPPPGPPRPAPAPKNVVKFPPVQPQPKPISEELHRSIVEAQNPLPPAPEPGRAITFAPWMNEADKQRILDHWKKER